MIIVEIRKNVEGFIRGFTVSGHSNYGEYGSDIVCSAVSALAQTTVLGLEVVANIKVKHRIKDGFLSCDIPDIENKDKALKASAIMDTMVLGLMNIQKNYSSYVRITIKGEV
jgi:uncharacterized protein YsxB (DUF464 family)